MKLTNEIKQKLYDRCQSYTENDDTWYFDLDKDTCLDVSIYTKASFIESNDEAVLETVGLDLENDDLIIMYCDMNTKQATLREMTEKDLEELLGKIND